jgi:[protein-PII] uridylyltransferase
MATKSFLSEEEVKRASQFLTPPPVRPDGEESRIGDFSSLRFSNWLGERLLARLSSHPDWQSSGPIALGSWSRGELSPKSDIDLLFCGDPEATARLVRYFSQEGLKLRYRTPEDLEDWTIGVEPFDVLALLHGLALCENWRAPLNQQLEKLRLRHREIRKNLLRAMVMERKARAARFDSISNYLEPNLKYGPGGLRDLEQALAIRSLFPERFQGPAHADHAFDVLLYYKRFFLLVRQRLHLSPGAGDLLSAPEQKPIADWLGFSDPKDFMREIQKGVSRVSFYADWVIARASRSPILLKAADQKVLQTPSQLFQALEADPSILMQSRVRKAADDVFARADRSRDLDLSLGKAITRSLDPARDEKPMVAMFRARLVDHCVPEFRRIIGHVQHDQYHRFTVDAHILQALRELKRLHRRPSLAGRLKKIVQDLSKKEWEILSFACLYHDIAKGRRGDHSIEGIEVARVDLERFGKDAALIREVCWIVSEHLALSAAAFRENPHSPATWQSLADKGVSGRRVALLAVFTIVDIRATNPDAWTSWKERLLHELVGQLERPETSSLIQFGNALRAARLDLRWMEALDPFLIGAISHRQLIEDIKMISHPNDCDGSDLSPAVLQVKSGRQTWVRFHSREDRAGLFMSFVRQLSSLGLGIRHASVHTDSDLGVYDWFEVKTTRTAAQVRKLLFQASRRPQLHPSIDADSSTDQESHIVFDSVEGIASDNREWVISFRGRDQSGALLEAARALYAERASIRWAKVHTWGRQIDDVIGISPLGSSRDGFNGLIERLSLRLVKGRSRPV